MADPTNRSRKEKDEEELEDTDPKSEPEVLSEEDIIEADDADVELLDDDEVQEEETTGKYSVPDHIQQVDKATEPGAEPQELDEDSFDEDTSDFPVEGDDDTPGHGEHGHEFVEGDDNESVDPIDSQEKPWEDDTSTAENEDAREFIEGMAAEEGDANLSDTSSGDLADEDLEPDASVVDTADTYDEPLSPRKSRRRRRRAYDDDNNMEQAEAGEYGAEETAAGEEPWNEEPVDYGEEDTSATPAGENGSFPDKTPPEGIRDPWQEEDEPVSSEGVTVRGEDPAFPQNADSAQERTLIFGEEGEAEPEAPEYPFLVVVQGEEEGREIDLIADEMSIGRGADNDLVFPDIACSRRHALLERQGDTYIVTDLGSGNGTQVNGARIQRAELHDADEIQVGSTIVQFNLPGAPAQPVASGTVTNAQPIATEGGGFAALMQDPTKRKYILFGGGGLLGFLLILVIVKVAAGPSGPPPPTAEEMRRQQETQTAEEFRDHLNAAKNLVNEKKWKDAGLRIQLALKLRPDDKIALEYKEFIERELKAYRSLQNALEFMDKKQYEKSMMMINQIPAESNYYKEARTLRKEIETSTMEELLLAGKELMNENKYAQAIIKFDEVLQRDLGNEAAAELKRQAEEKLDMDKKRIARLEAARRRQQKRKNRPKRPRKKKSGLTGQALSFYRNGEIDKAIRKAEESGSSQQLVKLKKFKAVYKKGMQYASKPGQAKKAIDYLGKALNLDKSISGSEGKYHGEIRSKLAKVYFITGVDAYMRHRYPEAYKCFCKALKYGYSGAKKRLQDLEKTAKKFYEEAYVIKSTNADQAVKKLNIVLKIIPPDHVYYQKAKKLKAKIQGPLGSSTESDTGF